MTNQTYIEEKKQEIEKAILEYLDDNGWKYGEDFYGWLIPSITQALQDAIKYGRDLELRILDRHIQEQIYERAITTDSLLKYIDEAREAIAKLTTLQEKKI